VIIKLKKQTLFFGFGIFLAVSLSFLVVDKTMLSSIKRDLIQIFFSTDPGFTSLMNLIDEGDAKFNNYYAEDFTYYSRQLIPSFFTAIPKIMKYKFQADPFERISIDIPFLEYKQIMLDRKNAIKIGLIQESSFVKVQLMFKGKSFEAKLRLKGDQKMHWGSRYRMSFRIELKGDSTILGFKKFSIQKPSTRYHPYDYSFASILKGANNLGAVHKFAHIYINGKDWGVMDIEEHMSKEFLEKQKRKESLIVRFSDEKKMNYQRNISKNPYPLYRLSDSSLYINPYDGKNYLKEDYYRQIYTYISKNHLEFNLNLYDVDSFSKSFILSTLWVDWHPLIEANSRYYFNPYTLRLESIATDQRFYWSLKEEKESITNNFTNLPEPYFSVVSSHSFQKNLPKNLDSISEVVSQVENYFDIASSFFPVNKQKNTAILSANMVEILSNKVEYLDLTSIDKYSDLPPETSSEFLKPTKDQASEFTDHLYVRHYKNGKLELFNLIPDDVKIKGILYEGVVVKDLDVIVPSYLEASNPLVIETGYLGLLDKKISILSVYQGFERLNQNQFSLNSERVRNPLLENIFKCSNFCQVKRGTYIFKKGRWVINSPIVIKGDLEIPAGTHLVFKENSYLIVQGSLHVSGSLDNPVILDSYSDFWGGIYVLESERRSYLKNLEIRNIKSLEDDLLRLTGAVTFYRADVNIENTLIDNVTAEDAINIVESDYKIKNLKVTNTISDALDSDFSNGKIEYSNFMDIGGDALDFSGSTVAINNVKVLRAGDKGVSAGEESFINIENSYFENIGIGVTSKDSSKVVVNNTSIKNPVLFGVMSFVKKDFYSRQPRVQVNNCVIDPPLSYMRQTGTYMTVDGKEVTQQDFNVDNLYKKLEGS